MKKLVIKKNHLLLHWSMLFALRIFSIPLTLHPRGILDILTLQEVFQKNHKSYMVTELYLT